MSCFCGHIHTSFAEALTCSTRLRGAGSLRPDNNTPNAGVRSVSPRQHSISKEQFPVTSRLMGRRTRPVGDLARDRARATGKGLLRTTPRGGRPSLSREERRRRARDRKRRARAAKKKSGAKTGGE